MKTGSKCARGRAGSGNPRQGLMPFVPHGNVYGRLASKHDASAYEKQMFSRVVCRIQKDAAAGPKEGRDRQPRFMGGGKRSGRMDEAASGNGSEDGERLDGFGRQSERIAG